MADLRPQFSEEVVGHGHPTKTDVTNRAWNIEHAEDGTHKVLPGASGIKMWFYQNTAPIGWTLDATPSDDLLAVKGGAQAYNAGGGTGAGTWTVAGLTKDAHTHAFTQPNNHTALALNNENAHTHTGPDHNHQWYKANAAAVPDQSYNSVGALTNLSINLKTDPAISCYDGAGGAIGLRTAASTSIYTTAAGTGATGAGSIHAHTFSQNITAHAGGSVNAQSNATISSTGNWRPKARLGIICTKN